MAKAKGYLEQAVVLNAADANSKKDSGCYQMLLQIKYKRK